MEIARIVLDYLKVLVWPLATLVIVYGFRGQIRELARRIRSVSAPGIDAAFSAEVVGVSTEAAAAVRSAGPMDNPYATPAPSGARYRSRPPAGDGSRLIVPSPRPPGTPYPTGSYGSAQPTGTPDLPPPPGGAADRGPAQPKTRSADPRGQGAVPAHGHPVPPGTRSVPMPGNDTAVPPTGTDGPTPTGRNAPPPYGGPAPSGSDGPHEPGPMGALWSASSRGPDGALLGLAGTRPATAVMVAWTTVETALRALAATRIGPPQAVQEMPVPQLARRLDLPDAIRTALTELHAVRDRATYADDAAISSAAAMAYVTSCGELSDWLTTRSGPA